jgi:WD40 repeat protein/Leucine-rich repeat (LRR) protein
LNSLEDIDLSENQLSGSIPESLGKLSRLQKLSLSHNQLSGSPKSLGELSNLQELNLSENQLSGSIPESLGELSNLQELNLSENQLSGSIPESLGELSNLQELNLSENQLSGSISESLGKSLGKLINLRKLNLSENQLSGFIYQSLGKLSNLGALDLYGNKERIIKIDEIDEIYENEYDALVDLYNRTNGNNWRNNTGWNKENTSCSSWYGVKCRHGHVIVLDLSHNQLSDYIPKSLGELSHLQKLDLSHNQLSDYIPESLGELSHLQELSLSENQLSGSIPESLGELSHLRELDLSHNQLSSIPESLGKLSNLEELNLHNNALCGNIPLSLMNLNEIKKIKLQNNHLTASNPELIAWLNAIDSSWAKNQTLFPEVMVRCVDNLIVQYKTDIVDKIWFGNDWLIPPDICTENEKILPALKYITQWISESDENFMTILGDLGTGKTMLVYYLALKWARAFQDDPLHHPAPVLIPLPDVDEDTLESIITNHLNAHGLPNVSYAHFELMLRSGQVILLFDDFNKMIEHTWSYSHRRSFIFDELLQMAKHRSKVISTCSTQAFKNWQKKAKEFLFNVAPLHHVQRQYLTRQHLVYLQLFDDAKIKTYLQRIRPEHVSADWDKIEQIYGRHALAERPLHPLLLDMIVKTLPQFDKSQPITAAKLYEYYANQRIQQKGEKKRLLDSQCRLQLLLEFAWQMWNSQQNSLSVSCNFFWKMWDKRDSQQDILFTCYKSLPFIKPKKRLTKDVITNNNYVITVTGELQTTTFLKHEGVSTECFTFLHPSFMEYLVAYKIHACLAKADISVLKTRLLDRKIVFFLTQLDHSSQFKALLENLLTNAYQPQISENALQVWYWSQRIVAGMVDKITDLAKLQQLLQLPSGVQFQNAQLDNIILEAATLPQAQLMGASLSNANLNNSSFYGSDLRQVDLTAAKCLKADFRACDLTKAQLQKVDFKEAILPADLRKKPQIDELPAQESLLAVVQRLHQPEKAALYKQGLSPQKKVAIAIHDQDGARFATRCEDGIIQIWRGANNRLLYTLEDHQESVESVLFDPNYAGLVSGGSDNRISKQRLKLPDFLKGNAVWSVAFDPNHARLASGDDDGMVRLWDLNSGKLLHTIDNHRDFPHRSVRSVAFDPNHAWLANVNVTEDLCGSEVRLWDLNSGELLHSFYSVDQMLGHWSMIGSVAFDPNHAQLAFGIGGRDDWYVQLWDLNSGEKLHTLRGFLGFDFGRQIWPVAFDPNHARLASSKGCCIQLWDLNSGELLHTLESHRGWVNRGWVNSVAFDPNHPELASGGDRKVRLWDPNSGELLHTLEGHTDEVLSVAFDPKRARLASGSSDKTVRLWDSQTGECLAVLSNHLGNVKSIAFFPNGRYLVAAGSAGRLQFWDLDTYETFLYLYGFDKGGWLALLPDGRFDANPEGMRYLCYTEKGTLNSYRAEELVKELYDPDGVKAVLAKYNRAEV